MPIGLLYQEVTNFVKPWPLNFFTRIILVNKLVTSTHVILYVFLVIDFIEEVVVMVIIYWSYDGVSYILRSYIG